MHQGPELEPSIERPAASLARSTADHFPEGRTGSSAYMNAAHSAADEVLRRLSAVPPTRSATLTSSQGDATRPRVIRRSIGLEMESAGEWFMRGKKQAGKGSKLFTPIEDTKSDLGSKDNLAAQADRGNLEFVTKPMHSQEQLNAVFEQLGRSLGLMRADRENTEGFDAGTTKYGLDWVSVEDWVKYQVRTLNDKDVGKYRFRPQATIDIALDKFEAFLNATHEADTLRVVGQAFEPARAAVQGDDAILGILESLEPMAEVTKGFYQAVLTMLNQAQHFPGHDDPKYAFPLMPRNRISEMYTNANEESKGEVSKKFDSFQTQVRDTYGDAYLFPAGYSVNRTPHQGPRVDQWIASIRTPEELLSGEGNADLMSPPPGQRDKAEGLGAYRMKKPDVAFYELRDFMSAASGKRTYNLGEIQQAASTLLTVEQRLRSRNSPDH